MAFFQTGLLPRMLVQASRSPPMVQSSCQQCRLLLHQQQNSQLSRQLRLLLPQLQSRFQSTRTPARSLADSAKPAPRFFTQTVRATSLTRRLSTATVPETASSIPSFSSSSSSSSSSSQAKTSSFPETSSKAVAYWLIASGVSVFGIVVWGGLTRLTESGLSITEWKPVTGARPPRSTADWEAEFALYRASPEYARLNPNMTLEEFKKIYFMEWFHRLWGRMIGLTFVLPALYFVARRRVSKRMAWHLFGIASLIGFQGFIGWWMVSSGLRDELFAADALPPRVSQYRLTAHLATAFVCYAWMLRAGLSVLRDHRLRLDPQAATKLASTLALPALQPLRLAVTLLTGLVFVTAMSGALVAGLDAGLIYNEFPMMGNGLTPPRAELWDPRFSRRADQSDLWWRNMLENPSLVQLDHRILATTTFCAVLALFFYSRRPGRAALLPANVRRGITGLVHLVFAQATLGICTLIYIVPTHLAATHQAGALALLTGALVLHQRLHIPTSSLRMLQKHLTATTAGTAAVSPSRISFTSKALPKTP